MKGYCRCAATSARESTLTESRFTCLHQQIKSKSGEVFARALVLPGCNHKEVDI